jgi:hypothetical protein
MDNYGNPITTKLIKIMLSGNIRRWVTLSNYSKSPSNAYKREGYDKSRSRSNRMRLKTKRSKIVLCIVAMPLVIILLSQGWIIAGPLVALICFGVYKLVRLIWRHRFLRIAAVGATSLLIIIAGGLYWFYQDARYHQWDSGAPGGPPYINNIYYSH